MPSRAQARDRVRPRVAASVAALSLVAAMASACGDRAPLGPSLSRVTVQDVTLQATAGNADLCCCRVVGTAINDNDERVHVTLKFSGFDGTDPVPIAVAVYFLEDMPTQQPQHFEASGFFLNCSRVKNVKTEIEVRGLDRRVD